MKLTYRKMDLKQIILFLVILVCIQGCQANYDLTDKNRSDGALPRVEFGSTCNLNYSSESRVSTCPLGRQELSGSTCSCNTQNGIQYGVVGR
jgi:hypothetical protein